MLRETDRVRAVTRVAVVGHVEWVDFVRVDQFPARGEVRHAQRAFARAAGGGAVAAAMLAELGARVDFFCALGRDDNGEAAAAELTRRGVTVHVAWRQTATRYAFTLLDGGGERTIVTVGERLQPAGDDELPWELLQRADGVYLTAGDTAAVRRARCAPVLVSTPRVREPLHDGKVQVDALVFSAADGDEVRWAQTFAAQTRLMVATEGGYGGHWWGESEGRWAAVPPPGEIQDPYGCGDSFAAGFTCGLAQGLAVADAAGVGAQCGARTLARSGAP
jgi:ribokinase